MKMLVFLLIITSCLTFHIEKETINNFLENSGCKFEDFAFHVKKVADGEAHIHLYPTKENLEIINLKHVLRASKSGSFVELEHLRKSYPDFKDDRPLSEQILTEKAAIDSVNSFTGVQTLQASSTVSKLVYFSYEGSIIKSFQLYDSSSFSDKTVWIVDASTGEVLHAYSRLRGDFAHVFPPGQSPAFGTKPPQTTISSLIYDGRNVNSAYGKDFHTSNTCFAYRCANRLDGDCDTSQSVCVDVTPEMKKGVDYFTSTYYFAIDGREIDFHFDWQANGYTNNNIIMAWENAPVAASRLYRPENQVWGSDLSWDNYTGKETDDAIVELQSYYFLDQHASFLRNLLNDSALCFLGSGPDCSVIDPATNTSDSANSSPMHVFTNYQQLQAYPSSDSKHADFLTQIFNQNRGKSINDPVLFDQSTGYSDAFYLHMPFFPNTSKNCSEAGCVAQNTFPYTHIAFGQDTIGNTLDWGLNECIAYHELTHALVNQFIPTLPSYVWAETGLRSDPGAMNEAWSDYFAAIACGISDFKRKTYNKRPGRSLDNTLTCQNSVGQVHTDGQIFGGGLWQVRGLLKSPADQTEYDRLILRALALGHSTDLFATQFNIILSLLGNNSSISYVYEQAKQIFAQREFDCERIQLVEESSDTTFQLPSNSITRANISTLPTQLKLIPRKSDWGAQFKWRQWSISPWLGSTDLGYATMPLQFVYSSCPIRVTGTNASNIQTFSNCSSTLSWKKTKYSNLYGSIDIVFPLESTSIYMIVASTIPQPIVMFSSSLTFYGFNYIWRITFMALSCIYFLLLLVVVAKLSKSILRNKGENRRPLWYLVFVFTLFLLPGLFALFGMIFGLVREIFTVLMFCCLFICVLLSLFFQPIQFLQTSSRFPSPPTLIRRFFRSDITDVKIWFSVITVVYLVLIAICFGLALSYSATVVAHSIFFAFFIIAFALHTFMICLQVFNSTFDFQVRDSGSTGREAGLIPLESLP